MKSQYLLAQDDEQTVVAVESVTGTSYRITIGAESLLLDVHEVGPGHFHFLRGDQGVNVFVEQNKTSTHVYHQGTMTPVQLLDEHQAARLAASDQGVRRSAEGIVAIRAPMPGKVVKTLVKEGETVTAGQGIIVIEAMKMENELRSAVDGTVKQILVSEGMNVESGENLVFIE